MTLRYIGEQATFSIGIAAAKASVEQGDNKSLKVLISKGLGPKPIISQYPYGFLMFSDGGGGVEKRCTRNEWVNLNENMVCGFQIKHLDQMKLAEKKNGCGRALMKATDKKMRIYIMTLR